jgi:hypothetical protein
VRCWCVEQVLTKVRQEVDSTKSTSWTSRRRDVGLRLHKTGRLSMNTSLGPKSQCRIIITKDVVAMLTNTPTCNLGASQLQHQNGSNNHYDPTFIHFYSLKSRTPTSSLRHLPTPLDRSQPTHYPHCAPATSSRPPAPSAPHPLQTPPTRSPASNSPAACTRRAP